MEASSYLAVIKVVGAGGGGTNAVSRMVDAGLKGVEFLAVNTDAQALRSADADVKLAIGQELTRGLGAGGNPEVGAGAASESRDDIKEALKGADMVFVTAGEGGGTGTGAAPVIAEIAKQEIGALTVGVVTKPFLFEGRQRSRRAELGLAQLAETVDTLITIPNQKLLMLGEDDLSFIDAFRKADEVLFQYSRAAKELWKFCNGSDVEFTASLISARAPDDSLLAATGGGTWAWSRGVTSVPGGTISSIRSRMSSVSAAPMP